MRRVNLLAELPPKLRQAVLLMKEGREWGDGRRRGHARHISIAVYRPAETIVQCLDRADQVLRDAVTGRLIDVWPRSSRILGPRRSARRSAVGLRRRREDPTSPSTSGRRG